MIPGLSDMARRQPNSILAIMIIALLACSSTASAVPNQSSKDQRAEARKFFEEGEQAYKSGHFDQAIEILKRAKALDPSRIDARIYLASAYAALCVPGSLSKQSIQMCKQVIPEFKEILVTDPKHLAAIDGMASILYRMAPMPATWPRPRLDLGE